MKTPKPVPTVRCPKCGEELPAKLLRKLAAPILGRKGGQATGPSKVRDHQTLSDAAKRRWDRWHEERKPSSVGYAYSSLKDDLNGIEAQKKSILAAAREHGYRVDKIFVDLGDSNKPHLKRLLSYCKRNKTKAVIVMIIDWAFVYQLEKIGTKLIMADRGIISSVSEFQKELGWPPKS